MSLTIWVVARFSPREWKEPKLCEDCLYVKLYGCGGHDVLSKNGSSSGVESDFSDDDSNDREVATFLGEDETLPPHSPPEWFENDFTLANSFWFAIGTLMQQGSDGYPKVQYLFFFLLNLGSRVICSLIYLI